MKTLYFENYGWCPELEISYRAGPYTPKTETEYEALKKYAIGNTENTESNETTESVAPVKRGRPPK